MPAYGSATPITLEAGRAATVWSAETLSLPSAAKSLAVALRRHANMPNCFSVEILFAATPGAFSVELQTSDTNDDTCFVTKTTLSSGLNSSFVGRIEVTNAVAKFARLNMATRTNAVAVTARFF